MNRSVYFIFFFILLQFFNSNAHAQTSVAAYFDAQIKKENLAVSNGKLFTNTFKTIDTDQFYASTFSSETIVYKDQAYADVELKYDLFRDVLIFRPYGKSENFGIELMLTNVNAFTLQKKTFVNLSHFTQNRIPFVKGYYEERFTSEKINLYIKHRKETKEFISNQRVFNSFLNYNKYLIYSNQTFYEVTSIKDIVKIFPNLKKELTEFKEANTSLYKKDKDSFFENVTKKISTLLQ